MKKRWLALLCILALWIPAASVSEMTEVSYPCDAEGCGYEGPFSVVVTGKETRDGAPGECYALQCPECGTVLLTSWRQTGPAETPEPKPEKTPKPTKEPKPEPTKEPAPKPTKEPTPKPTKEPKPEPTKEPAPKPTKEPAPKPTKEPAPKPTKEQTPKPTKEPKQPEPEKPVTPPPDPPTEVPATEKKQEKPTPVPAPAETPPPVIPDNPVPAETPLPAVPDNPPQQESVPVQSGNGAGNPAEAPAPHEARNDPPVTDPPGSAAGQNRRNLRKYPYFSAAFPSRRLDMEGDPKAKAPVPGIRIYPAESVSILDRMLNGD